MNRKFVLIILTGAVLLIGATAVSFVAGVAMVHYKTTPYRIAIEKLREMRRPKTETGLGRHELWSVFVPLEYTVEEVEVSRAGRGGALTPFIDGILLLTHEGRFFYSEGAGQVAEVNLNPPENGFTDLKRDAESLADEYRFLPNTLRYNDVLARQVVEGTELFVSFTRYISDQKCYQNVVSRGVLSQSAVNDLGMTSPQIVWSELFSSSPCLSLTKIPVAFNGITAGGRMVIKGDKLYLGSGDFEWDGMSRPLAVAQLPSHDYGKVIEISLSTGEARQFTSGQRNIQGIAVDLEGDIYSVEHGVLGGDELNLIEEGNNYGWPMQSLGTGYNGLQLSTTTTYARHDDFKRPIYAWLPSIAISSLNLIEDFHEAWNGDLLLATLKGAALHRLRIRDRKLIFDEVIYFGERIRYAVVIPNNIVLWTDSKKLIWLTVAEGSRIGEFVNSYLDRMEGSATQKKHVRTALSTCQTCHSLEPGRNQGAPSLAGIYGKPVASAAFEGYSTALSSMSGNWDDESLRQMILDPEGFVPGTNMPDPGVNDPEVADAIIQLLAKLREVE